MSYVLTRHLPGAGFEETVARTRAAAAAQGFGIPTEMDTQAIFKAKLGMDTDRRIILGTCLPAVAAEVLAQDPGVATLLPCNVVVHETGGGITVSAVDPEALFSLTGLPDTGHAHLVKDKLTALLEAL